jgi:hypothetical protein
MKSFTHRSTFHLALLIGALACLTTTGCGDSTPDTSDKTGSGGIMHDILFTNDRIVNIHIALSICHLYLALIFSWTTISISIGQ